MDEAAHILCAIVDAGSISAAARALHYSQPALSKRLRSLESDLGIELVSRESRTLKLTAAGELYLQYARNALASENAMLRQLQGMKANTWKTLALGASLSRADKLLPDVLVDFYSQSYHCAISVCNLESEAQAAQYLSEGIIDFAVVTPIRQLGPGFLCEPLYTEHYELVVSPDNILAAQFPDATTLPISVLKNMPLILPAQAQTFRRMIASAMESAGVFAPVILDSYSTVMTLSLIQRNIGVAIMPNTSSLQPAGDGLRRFALNELNQETPINCLFRDNAELPAEGKLFMTLLRRHLAALACQNDNSLSSADSSSDLTPSSR